MDTELIRRYEIVAYWSDADWAFLAEMPELAGCMSDGDTEARRNIEVTAPKWINRTRHLGRTIPAPRALAAA